MQFRMFCLLFFLCTKSVWWNCHHQSWRSKFRPEAFPFSSNSTWKARAHPCCRPMAKLLGHRWLQKRGRLKSEGSFWLVQFSYGSRATWQKYKFLRTAAWLGVSQATCWRTTSVVSRPGVNLYVLRLVVLLLDGNLLASKHKDSTASL